MSNPEIKEIIKHLISVRHDIFNDALNYSLNHELKDFNDMCEIGETFVFELDHLDNSKDINLQLLVDLIKNVQSTCESLANLNNIDIDLLETD